MGLSKSRHSSPYFAELLAILRQPLDDQPAVDLAQRGLHGIARARGGSESSMAAANMASNSAGVQFQRRGRPAQPLVYAAVKRGQHLVHHPARDCARRTPRPGLPGARSPAPAPGRSGMGRRRNAPIRWRQRRVAAGSESPCSRPPRSRAARLRPDRNDRDPDASGSVPDRRPGCESQRQRDEGRVADNRQQRYVSFQCRGQPALPPTISRGSSASPLSAIRLPLVRLPSARIGPPPSATRTSA